MNHDLAFAFQLCLLSTTWFLCGPNFPEQAKVRKQPDFVRFSIINMSGEDREACLSRTKVDLPFAVPVALQALPGEAIRITSDTDSKVSRTIMVSSSINGYIYPVN